MARTVLSELAEIVQPEPGRHRRPEDGVCTMELVAWISGEKHSDHPLSVSPVIAAFTRAFNDALDDTGRQRLGALAPRMIDTRGTPEAERMREQLLWDWMVTTAVPEWLRAAGRAQIAEAMLRDRAAALAPATAALDSYGHAPVRPVDDHETARAVSSALGTAAVTAACIAGHDTADSQRGPRARRRWQAALTVARSAAWEVAEADTRKRQLSGAPDAALWRTARRLREDGLALVDRLIFVTAPPPPPPPPPADSCAEVRGTGARELSWV